MEKSIKEKLILKGVETLADLLIEIGKDSELASNKIERLISNKSQNIMTFKDKLNYFANDQNRYIPWKHSSAFARDVLDLLYDIKAGASTAENGIKLLVQFYKADEHILNMVDDSNGFVGDVFTCDALELFVEYAKKVTDKNDLIYIIVDLMSYDNFGIRASIIHEASRYLDNEELRQLFDLLKTEHDKDASSPYNSFSWHLQSLARQMKDAPLYEKLCRDQFDGPIGGKFLVDIAREYLEVDDVSKAQDLLNEIRKDDTFASNEKNSLQREIYKITGDTKKLILSLENYFMSWYSESTLEALLEVVGQDQKEKYVSAAIRNILDIKGWSSANAQFLIDIEAFQETSTYIMKRFNDIDGDEYGSLLDLAEALEKKKYYLATSLIYRTLLESILQRGISKYYHHGVRYLCELDRLAKRIEDCNEFDSHTKYFSEIKRVHFRKRAFWSKY